MRSALLLTLLLSLPGCTTVLTIATSGAKHQARRSLLYSGTRGDLRFLTEPFALFGPGSRVLWAIDLPFSFVLDTALLPLTLVQSLTVWCSDPLHRAPPEPDPPPPPSPAPDVVVGGRPWREPRERRVDAPREYRLPSAPR